MTNAILKRLAKKGWLTIRKVNNRRIHYVVTPRGMQEIARRSYRYLRRTIGNVVRYREAIEGLVESAAARGYKEVLLVGQSDLVFIFEHACAKARVGLRNPANDASVLDSEAALVVLSEREAGLWGAPKGAVPLRELLILAKGPG